MKKLSRVTVVALIVVFILLISGCSGSTQQPAEANQQTDGSEIKFKKEYQLTTNAASETTLGKGAEKFAELAKEYTDGKVNIKVYPNAMLVGGDQMRQVEMVQSGAIDFMFNPTSNIAPTIPEFSVFNLPFLFPNSEAVDAAIAAGAADPLLELLDKNGIVGLGWGELGLREITNNKGPITSPDDFKGLKMRVVNPMYIDIMRALGANPVAMNWGEVFTALQQGTIDGQENPIVSVIIPQRVYEVQKYLTNWHYSYDAISLAANKQVWNSFPKDIQDQLQKAATEAMEYQKDITRAGLIEGIKFLEQQGLTITDLTSDQLQAFKDQVKPVYDNYAEKIGLDLVKGFEDAVAEAAK